MRASAFATTLLVAATSPLLGQARAPTDAVATVAQLYRDFAWEAVVEEPDWRGHGLLEQPRSMLLRYFDERLTDLLLRDRACQIRTRGLCRLDFDPIWASQDPGATELKVLPTQDSAVVVVTFRYPNITRDSIALKYQLKRTKSGWRIDDISQGTEPSLATLLSRKE